MGSQLTLDDLTARMPAPGKRKATKKPKTKPAIAGTAQTGPMINGDRFAAALNAACAEVEAEDAARAGLLGVLAGRIGSLGMFSGRLAR